MVKGYQIAPCAGGYEVFSDDYGILDGEFESYDEACSAAHEHAASILVREVADDRLSHGERTFAYGIGALLLVTAGLIVAPALRIAGLL